MAADGSGEAAYWRSVIGRAVERASHPEDPGPVHVNLPFDEPLVPDTGGPVGEPVFDDEGQARAVRREPRADGPAMAQVLETIGLDSIPERGLVVVGDIPVGSDTAVRIAALAQACGWPIIAEPTAELHGAPTWLPAGSLVAGSRDWLREHEPELVVSAGRVGLTREVAALVRSARHRVVVDPSSRWSDPTGTAAAVVAGAVPVAPPTTDVTTVWLAAWLAAGARAARRIDAVLDEERMFTGLHVARHLWRSAPDSALLFLAASWPIRQVQLTAGARTGLRVMANRGVNGIDGLVSTAWGAALAHAAATRGTTVAMLGDLAFLHDGNGLLAQAGEDRPPLQLVVTDNDGGGIFSQLEQGRPEYRADFERVFGTPHGLHLVGRARLCGVPARGVDEAESFVTALADPPEGASVLVAQVADRGSEADLMARARIEAVAAVAEAG